MTLAKKRGINMDRCEKTSKEVGSIESGLLRKKRSFKKVKSISASALTQRPNKKKR